MVPVEVLHGGRAAFRCAGPDDAGGCPRVAVADPVPCAGGDVVVRPADDDLWLFAVAPGQRGCPLGWLVTGPRESTPYPPTATAFGP